MDHDTALTLGLAMVAFAMSAIIAGTYRNWLVKQLSKRLKDMDEVRWVLRGKNSANDTVHYWSEQGWVSDPKKATLFKTENGASSVLNALLVLEPKGPQVIIGENDYYVDPVHLKTWNELTNN